MTDDQTLKKILWKIWDRARERERERDRKTDTEKMETERDFYVSLPADSLEHNEVVHSKHFQRKIIRTY